MKKLISAGMVGLFIGMSFSGCFLGSFAASYFKNLDTRVEAAVVKKVADIEAQKNETIKQPEPAAQPNQAKEVTPVKTSASTAKTAASTSSKKTSTTKPKDESKTYSDELVSLTKKFVNILYNTNIENLDKNFKILNSMGVPGGFMGSKEATDYFYEDMLDTTLVYKSMNIKSVQISNTYDSSAKKTKTTATVYADIKCLEDGIDILDCCEFDFIYDNSSKKWKVSNYRWVKQ